MANHYIRDGGTGDGSAWNNALDDLPVSFVRGDTYYLADGNYGGHTFSQATSGTSVIYIKKATEADHGNETGWNSSYGDGEAFISGVINFTSGYWDIDGQVGEGKGGYGIRIYSSSVPVTIIKIDSGSHIILKHIDASTSTEGVAIDDPSWFCIIVEATAGGTGLTIANNYFHKSNQWAMIGTSSWTDVVITDNYFEYAYRKELWVGRFVTNGTFARNICENACGTGPLQFQTSSNILIYNNLFFTNDNDYTNSSNLIGNFNGNGYVITTCLIYGNTFVNTLGNSTINFDAGTNIDVKNNIFYGSLGAGFSGVVTHDYNWCYDTSVSGKCSQVSSEAHGQVGSGDPFAGYSGSNFHLIGATNGGYDALGSPYNTDIEETARGVDGVWDRGAYEYNEETSSITVSKRKIYIIG